MKIYCTEEEKENLLDILVFVCSYEFCPLIKKCDTGKNKGLGCVEIWENEVEWNITDSECGNCNANYSEEYKKIKKEWDEKPDYLKETYNINFATSKHSKKLVLKNK